MDSSFHGVSKLFFFLLLLLTHFSIATSTQINSNSILVALLDSHYTELAELVEKALLLQTLEQAVGQHNITIFAPPNEAFNPQFKAFLLQPRNLKSLQSLVMFHILPQRINANQNLNHLTNNRLESAKILRPDDIIKPDGIIHGIDRLLIPHSVQDDFNKRRNLRSISAVLPEGAPEIDLKTHRLKKKPSPIPAGSPPILPVFNAMSPAPSLAPAPAPGPGGPHHHFNGEAQVKDFIHTLLNYGCYNELADILVNLTSLATEMGRLVSEGYVLTVLAPNDEAMAKLTTDQLSEPGAPEEIVYYHIIPEYQTEESMYNAVRRFGKIRYDSLRFSHKLEAEEADGSVKFGHAHASAYLFDPDIYTDGRISVQGIDGVLLPEEEIPVVKKTIAPAVKKTVTPRRGRLMELACTMIGSKIFKCQ